MLVHSVDNPGLSPFEMPGRFRTEITYFITPGDTPGAPKLAEGEYWVRREDAQRWLEDGVVSVVSPLDATATAEIELSEEQEAWLEWLVTNDIQHVRIQ